MPTLEEIENNRKQGFKKRDYRSWNVDGSINLDTVSTNEESILSDSSEHVLLVPTDKIENWAYSDRPSSELGDITALAEDFKLIGQQQPCIVRPNPRQSGHYELIAGERRWHAAKLAGTKLKVISKNLSDKEAALIQAAENESRKGLSDYAKGMNYARLIDQGVLAQSDLINILKISKQQVSRLLSYNKIPSIVIDEIGDMTKVSARTAEQIKQICAKGDEYIKIVLEYSKLLRDGKLGCSRLVKLVSERINPSKIQTITTLKSYYDRDEHLFTWKKDKNNIWSLSLSESISKLISIDTAESSKLKEEIKNVIKAHLTRI